MKRAEQMLRDRRDGHCSCHWQHGKLCGVHQLDNSKHSNQSRLYLAVYLVARAWGVPDEEAHEWATIAE